MADISDTILTELRSLIKEIKKVYDETPRGTAEETVKDMNKHKEDLKEIDARLIKIQNKYDNTNKSLKDQIGLLEEANNIQGEYLGILNKAQENEEEQLRLLREQIDLREDQIALLKAMEEDESDKYKELQEELDQLIALEKERTKVLEEQKEATKALGTASDGFEDIIETFTGVTRSSDGFLSSIVKASEGAGGFSGVIKQLGGRFMSIMNPMNIALSIFSKIQEATGVYARDLDQVTSQLAASTAETEKYNYVLQNSWREMGRFGMGVKEAGEAQLALKRESLSFSELNKSQQMQLVKTTAAMERFGLSAQETASTFDTLKNALGFTAEESQEALREVVSLSNKLQIDSGTLTKAFAASQKSLAAYGKAAPRIFAEVAAASKATRIEVGRLLEITEQFDTFESAAQAAGSLNAILGGDLVNSMELLRSSGAEREDIISNVMDTARKQYQGLGEVQQKYLVKTLGSALQMSDEEVKKYLNSSSSRLADYDTEAAKRTANQEDFNKALAAATPIAAKMVALFNKFAAPLGTFINFADKVADALVKFDKVAEDFQGPIDVMTTSINNLLGIGEKAGAVFATAATAMLAFGGVGIVKVLTKFPSLLKPIKDGFIIIKNAVGWVSHTISQLFAPLQRVMKPLSKLGDFFSKFASFASPLAKAFNFLSRALGPLMGALNVFEVFKELMEGDWVGAIWELVQTILYFIPGLGTALATLMEVVESFKELFDTMDKWELSFDNLSANWERLKNNPLGFLFGDDNFMGDQRAADSAKKAQQVDDFILRPGKEPIKFNKDDLIMGGTSLLSQNSQAYSNVSNTSIFNGGGAAPVAPMRDRDLVIQIDGREIARVASKHLKKEYGFSYG